MGLSRTVSEMYGNFGPPLPLGYLETPLRGLSMEFHDAVGIR